VNNEYLSSSGGKLVRIDRRAHNLSSFLDLRQLTFQLCNGILRMANLLLNFARVLFSFPFDSQLDVVRNLAYFFLDRSL